MPNPTPLEEDETIITLEGDDGQSYSCQLIDVFEFEKQEYALLLRMTGSEPAADAAGTCGEDAEKEQGEGSLVVMRLTQRDDQAIFQTIEDDKEFERVISYVEELAQESLNDTSEETAKAE